MYSARTVEMTVASDIEDLDFWSASGGVGALILNCESITSLTASGRGRVLAYRTQIVHSSNSEGEI
jgi:hypothetical protein